jgi:regulatory protein
MKLGEGTVIKKERLLELKRIEEIHRAKQKGLRLLDRRSYSAAQLKAKLEEDLFSPEAIEEVLKGFSSHNYINDDRFAQDLITAELKRKPIGRRFLYQRLLHKGIKRTTALQMIEAGYSIEQEEELCEKLMEKLIRKRGTDIKKIFPTLARRGFGGPLIKKVFERLRKKK